MTTVQDVEISGDDSQNVFGNTVSHDLIVNQFRYARERRSMSLAEGEIAERLAEYVPAANHAEIVRRLARDRAVALCGPPGAGVATTAIAALRELRPGLEVRRFTAGEDDVAEIRPADAVGYLVRAADEDASRLRACAEAMRDSGGFLLVVGAEGDHRAELSDFLPPVRVVPPPADAVYRRRLACRGLGETGWPDWPRAAELLKDGTPGEARRLADIVRATEREGGGEEEAERAYQGWEEQHRAWFADHPEPRDQALMIAAATVSPADETSVYGAALSLARQLDIEVAGRGLAWCPSTGLGDLIGAGGNGGRIVFRRQGYAESVLRYVWRDYPPARTDLLAWLAALPADDGVALDAPLARRVVEVFADLAAEHGAADLIARTAHGWASRDQADLAQSALVHTCLHPVVGGRVRRSLYDWSRERRTPQTLKLTIVRVSQMLGVTYPSVAMTRLKHLAAGGNEQVRDEVAAAAVELAQVHHARVVEAALGWCGSAARYTSGRDAARLADTALRVLVRLLESPPDGAGPPPIGAVLAAVERLAASGDAVSGLALRAARELAVLYRAVVVRAALVWTDAMRDDPFALAPFGASLFLELAAEKDAGGLAATLTGPDAVDAAACARAWHMALLLPPDQAAAVDGAARLWLDTALARGRLRPRIAECFARTPEGDPVQRRRLAGLVRAWAAGRPDRAALRDDLLAELLLPEWKRLLVRLRVAVRAAAG